MPDALIHPITLGKIQFSSNLIQAPLAGISSAPFREAISQFGGAAYSVSEMISAKTLLHNPAKRYIYKGIAEGLVCFQLSGNHPAELKAAAMQVIRYGADLIDINCGCPVDKIRKKNCGSKLLAQSQVLREVIQAIKSRVDVPVSIKIRVDGESGDRFNTDVIKAAEDAGADFIIVHGRHWTEHYDRHVRFDEIAAIVAVARIPVIGNGDVHDYASLKKMFSFTGCAGVMIGRASVGRPWLFAMLAAEDRGEKYQMPTREKIGALFLKQIEGLMALENETLAVLQARKLSKYYVRAAELPIACPLEFNNIRKFTELAMLVKRLFI